MEAGQVRKPLLVKVVPDNVSITDSRSCGEPLPPNDSSVAAVLVRSIFVTASVAYSSGCVGGFAAPAEPGIIADLGLSLAEYSVFGSIVTIGGMIGALTCGRIADLIGLKYTIWTTDVITIIGWLAVVFGKGPWLLDIGRLLLGFGSGISAYAGPIYLAEIVPKNLRGRLVSIVMLMLPMAAVFMFFIGSSVHWRTIALIGIVPCIPPLVAVIFIPESPRWLAKMGRAKECESALDQLRGKNADIFQEAADIKECNKLLNQISDDGIMNLFQLKYAHIVIVGVGLMAMQQLGGLNGFSLYKSEIFDAAGFPSKLGFIVLSLGQLPLIFAGAYLIDKLGRRTLLMVSATGTFLGCFLTGLSFFFQGLHWFEEYTPTLVLIGISRLFLIRHGTNTVVNSVRDISHKCERLAWKHLQFCELVLFLVCCLYIQLLISMELSRNLFHIFNYLLFEYHIHCKTGARDKGEVAGRNTCITDSR